MLNGDLRGSCPVSAENSEFEMYNSQRSNDQGRESFELLAEIDVHNQKNQHQRSFSKNCLKENKFEPIQEENTSRSNCSSYRSVFSKSNRYQSFSKQSIRAKEGEEINESIDENIDDD